jgi:hypothetical protein
VNRIFYQVRQLVAGQDHQCCKYQDYQGIPFVFADHEKKKEQVKGQPHQTFCSREYHLVKKRIVESVQE